MDGVAIQVEGLKKRFGDVMALDGIDFSVPERSVFGLLGPNGAGKTTAIRILATVLEPDEGRASVLGHDVAREPDAVRRRIFATVGLALGDPETAQAAAFPVLAPLVFASTVFVPLETMPGWLQVWGGAPAGVGDRVGRARAGAGWPHGESGVAVVGLVRGDPRGVRAAGRSALQQGGLSPLTASSPR